jgi:hypothetical protein
MIVRYYSQVLFTDSDEKGGFGNEMVVYGEYDVKLVVHGGK